MPTIITIASQKGGSGKTSLAMLLASAASTLNLKVHLLDADRNFQLLNWKSRMESYDFPEGASPPWPNNIYISKLASDYDHITEQINDEKFDIIIIDTRPGNYTDTEDIAYASDLILIPSSIEGTELDLSLDTYKWISGLQKKFDVEKPPLICLSLCKLSKNCVDAFNTTNVDKLTNFEYSQLIKLNNFNHLTTVIPSSKIISQMSVCGPLDAQHKTRTSLKSPLSNSITLSKTLLNEIRSLLGE